VAIYGVVILLFFFLFLCIATEPTDHSIVDAQMTVIWARGQEPGQYVHSPHSGLEKGSASDPEFYKADEIKYHGQKDQRGVVSMNFFG
jgi:hypothetical protein